MTNSTSELMTRGMNCLKNGLGIIEAEQFISVIIRERFDYTEWQRRYFDSVNDEDFVEKVAEFERTHPYKGKAKVISGSPE